MFLALSLTEWDISFKFPFRLAEKLIIVYWFYCGGLSDQIVPVSQDISEPDESEPFRFILALAAGYFGTIPINPDPSGRIFRNH